MEVIKMAIEPLSSAMTFQAQPVQAQSQNVSKASETTEGQTLEQVVSQVDKDTLAVKKSEEKADSNQDSNQKEDAPSKDIIKAAMQELNKKATSVSAEFGIHEKTNRITIKMVDKKTKKVIKELPPEKTLDMIAKIWEMAGLIVDEKR